MIDEPRLNPREMRWLLQFKEKIMEAIIVLSSALLFRMIVWEDMETYLFMLKCKRNVRHINKMFADLEKRIDEELRKQKS